MELQTVLVLAALVLGWALNECSDWLHYRRQTPVELRERLWEKAETFEGFPRAWDRVFSKDCCYWLGITLTDGTNIVGYYGTNSFTSSYPHEDDIYVEDVWYPDKGETYTDHERQGLLVERRQISRIVVREVEVQEGDDGQ